MPLCSVKSSYCQRLGVGVLYTERVTSSSGLPNRYYQVFFPQSTFPWRRRSEALCREKGLSQSCRRYACDASTPQAATQSSSIPPELCDLWGEEAYQGHNSCVCLVFGTSHRHGTSRALRHRRRTDTDVYETSFASISFSWKN